ncbi:hypothetical protein GCM10007907_17140 [Chitinimonas prasina]|uniref:N-acetyltransferase domain-containing protein n=1 Tax=Chitinimonas prasina TaxID=1434937 RepID=A0ABQ5YDP9_9NEIS|nr:UDP-2,4-diacetamido-2,4,6-trideoxy-beta-L-altropyranose hydrolase [Chitinimonas prasina]GLR12924.1 hypothetical protein GCM10007907_17140 [Chitinimonas prasina]
MNILFRADASLAIGSGHVMRCLTLAHVLATAGAKVSFACRALPGNALGLIADQGFVAHALPAVYPGEVAEVDIEAALDWQADIDALRAVLSVQAQFDWVVVDHYGLDAHWQQAARQYAQCIAVVDDLANRGHAADLLLDQNLSALHADYTRLLPNHARALLGPRYALLRPAYRGGATVVSPLARRVMVSFGGVDAGGETFKAMDALADLPDLEVDFVAGAANPAWAGLVQKAEGKPHWRLHRHVADFASLMRQADLFVGAGGGTSWERAALGLPTVCIAVAPNQVANAEHMAAAGAQLYLGEAGQVTVAGLREAIRLLAGNHGLRLSLSQRSGQLVDGLGAQRVAAALLAQGLRLRPATQDDARLLHEGRNAESVRRWSLQTAPIPWDRHLAWLAASLLNPDRRLLVAEASDGPVGVLRYDHTGAGRAEVSIYLLAGREGLGWARAMLQRGDQHIKQYWPDLLAIDAIVRPDNQASLGLFRQAGYVQADCHFVRHLEADPASC